MLQKDLRSLKKEKEDLLIQIRELDMRSKLSNDFQVFFLHFQSMHKKYTLQLG